MRSEALELCAAMGGDPEAFTRLTEPHRRALHLHCYRMLGSFQDAEDGVQEALIRAWRHLATFEGRSSFRNWLYRIATNVCLAEKQRRRQTPASRPAADFEHLTDNSGRALHLSPYPDVLLAELEAPDTDVPTIVYDLSESIQLGFVAALQLLPPRQRAALILRDVLGFHASEVAEMLDSTIASANNALARARATLAQQRAAGWFTSIHGPTSDDVAESLVRRYVDAWRADDISGLVALLTSDVVLSGPSIPVRRAGRQNIAEYFKSLRGRAGAISAAERAHFRFVPTRANRQPAVAVYRRMSDGVTYRGIGVWVLAVDGDAIAAVTVFVDPALVKAFGLPGELRQEEAVSLLF
jgi:RNA polymerase sigma-70 factor (ECF subfamily)